MVHVVFFVCFFFNRLRIENCKLILGLVFPPFPPFPGSKPVLSQQVGLPHVLPLREPLWDLDLLKVLNALFQLLLHCHLLFRLSFFAAATRVTGARR